MKVVPLRIFRDRVRAVAAVVDWLERIAANCPAGEEIRPTEIFMKQLF